MIIRKIVLAGVVFSIASPLFAAEIYNKDGNQLQLTGAVHARHYFSDDISLFSISISDIINSNTMVKPSSVFFITTPLFFFIIWLCLDGLSLVFLYQLDVERLRL